MCIGPPFHAAPERYLCQAQRAVSTHVHILIVRRAQAKRHGKVHCQKIVIYGGKGSNVLEGVPYELMQRNAHDWIHAEGCHCYNETKQHHTAP